MTHIALPQSGRFTRFRQTPVLHRYTATDGRMRLDSTLSRASRNARSDGGQPELTAPWAEALAASAARQAQTRGVQPKKSKVLNCLNTSK